MSFKYHTLWYLNNNDLGIAILNIQINFIHFTIKISIISAVGLYDFFSSLKP